MSDENYKKLFDAREYLSRCQRNLDEAIEAHHEKHKQFDKRNASFDERVRYNHEYAVKDAEISKDIKDAYDKLFRLEVEFGLRSKN